VLGLWREEGVVVVGWGIWSELVNLMSMRGGAVELGTESEEGEEQKWWYDGVPHRTR